MDKYPNRRVMHRKAGKFSAAPTLEQQGYPINTARLKCISCDHEWMPILIPQKCVKCGTEMNL